MLWKTVALAFPCYGKLLLSTNMSGNSHVNGWLYTVCTFFLKYLLKTCIMKLMSYWALTPRHTKQGENMYVFLPKSQAIVGTVRDDFAPLSQNGWGRQERSVTPSLTTSLKEREGEKDKRGKKKGGRKGRKSHVRLKWLYIQNKYESCEETHEEIDGAREW